MQEADAARAEAMANLNAAYPDGIPSMEDDPEGYRAYWESYNNI